MHAPEVHNFVIGAFCCAQHQQSGLGRSAWHKSFCNKSTRCSFRGLAPSVYSAAHIKSNDSAGARWWLRVTIIVGFYCVITPTTQRHAAWPRALWWRWKMESPLLLALSGTPPAQIVSYATRSSRERDGIAYVAGNAHGSIKGTRAKNVCSGESLTIYIRICTCAARAISFHNMQYEFATQFKCTSRNDRIRKSGVYFYI
jgi:hypothetical protein